MPVLQTEKMSFLPTLEAKRTCFSSLFVEQKRGFISNSGEVLNFALTSLSLFLYLFLGAACA